MADELKVRITGEIPEGAERSSVRARFAPDAADDVQGQGWRWNGLSQTEDDTEGQGGRYTKLGQAEDDTEGHWVKIKLSQTEDDTEGQGRSGYGGLRPVEDDDTEGDVLRSHVLEIERDEDGGLAGRFVPAEADDTEGQGQRYGG